MKKWTLLLLLLMLYGVGMAQTKKLVGTVYNSSGIVPIVGCQVHNISTGDYVFGDDNGRFIMSVSVNDSLVISHSGYSQSLVVIDNRDYSRGRKDIILYHKAFMLPNFTCYGLNPSYEGFKRDVATVKLPDSYKNIDDVHLTKEERRNATYTEEAPNILKNTKLASPITWLYSTFNKKEKMRRLYYEMEGYGEEVQQVQLKYNRELVSEITGLQEPELLDFMVYCHFSYYDLIRWSREKIIDEVRTKFFEYQYFKALEEDDQ